MRMAALWARMKVPCCLLRRLRVGGAGDPGTVRAAVVAVSVRRDEHFARRRRVAVLTGMVNGTVIGAQVLQRGGIDCADPGPEVDAVRVRVPDHAVLRHDHLFIPLRVSAGLSSSTIPAFVSGPGMPVIGAADPEIRPAQDRNKGPRPVVRVQLHDPVSIQDPGVQEGDSAAPAPQTGVVHVVAAQMAAQLSRRPGGGKDISGCLRNLDPAASAAVTSAAAGSKFRVPGIFTDPVTRLLERRKALDQKSGGRLTAAYSASCVFSVLEMLHGLFATNVRLRDGLREIRAYLRDPVVRAALRTFPLAIRRPLASLAVLALRLAYR